jgi:arginyl-tRNA synthetase
VNLKATIESRIAEALAAAGAGERPPALVAPASRAEFGDYQANGVMAAAKRLKRGPRELAEAVAAAAKLDDLAEKVEVAGPGFVNVTLKREFLERQLAAAAGDERLGVVKPAAAETVVVDYSGPNLAKEMHVGHLRSTIIGDALARVLKFIAGEPLEARERVIPQNHVGDWGTQFGVVILGLWHICMARRRKSRGQPYYIDQELPKLREGAQANQVRDLIVRIRDRHEEDWRADSRREKGDGEVVFGPFLDAWTQGKTEVSFDELQTAYHYVTLVTDFAVSLGIDLETRPLEGEERATARMSYGALCSRIARWVQMRGKGAAGQESRAHKRALEVSLKHAEEVYGRLSVLLRRHDVRGESAYNDDLPNVLKDLDAARLLAESEGAKGVFLDDFRNKDNEPAFVILQKSDGGYLYATTDLAAIRYRVGTLNADRVLYVVDSRQAEHFAKVFKIAEKARWDVKADGGKARLEHVAFGMMLGEGRTPFRTREGGTVKLTDLLDEAESRALDLVRRKADERGEQLDEETLKRIAEAVGIGAVKYADLSQNPASDYVFSWDKMLSLEGNTAPYMQYAYARIRSIFRRAGEESAFRHAESAIALSEPGERALGLKLLQFPETVETVAADCLPSAMCSYLFDLAGAFMGFYETCPVLKSDEPLRSSRLALCDLTARVIERGLDLLGIRVVDRM